MRSIALATVALCALAGPALATWPSLSPPPAATGGGAKDAALVIAIEDYFAVPDVAGARANGSDWVRWLTKTRGLKPQNVVTLWDGDATAEAMARAADAVAAKAGKGGTVWVVFIGHGAPAKSRDDGLLVAVDAQQTTDGVYGRSLAQKDLAARLGSGPQARTLIVVDACFSGQTAGGEPLAKGVQPMLPVDFVAGSATVLTAGTSQEFAGALPGVARPAFSYLLLGALRGWGDADQDGAVTVSEAVDYARTTLGTVVRGRTQTPQAYGPKGFDLASGAREKGPDLTAFIVAPTSDPTVKAAGFGKGLAPVAAGPLVRDLDVAVSPSFSDVDTDLLDLLQAAKNVDTNALASPKSKAKAWTTLAKYKKGAHGLADKARARAKEWKAAASKAKAREKSRAKVAKQMKADGAKLDKLLGYRDDIISAEQKAAYRAEFERVYGPWRKELGQLAARAPDKVVRPARPVPADKKPRPIATDEVYRVLLSGRDADLGNRTSALVTLVVFSEFQCPFCSRLAPTLKAILAKYGDDVRLVFKHNPLAFHKQAFVAAEAALCAKDQGKFWAMHDMLFANQKALQPEQLESYATQLGLNGATFRKCMAGRTHKAQIEADMALAGKVTARGTPTTFINGRKVSGARPLEALTAVVEEELAKARAMVAKGVPRSGVYGRVVAGGEVFSPLGKQSHTFSLVDAPIRGSAGAPIQIVGFASFQCPYCGRLAPVLEGLQKRYGRRAALYYKHFPLSFHKASMPAAIASVCAHAQGQFWPFHDLIFANQKALTDANFKAWASQLGLNGARFQRCRKSPATKARVERDMAEAREAGVKGTPTVFVNGREFISSGGYTVDSMAETIDSFFGK